MSQLERLSALFSGYVQGVGFRFTAVRIARGYPAITGFVRNLPDGSVELLAEGSSDDLDMFLDELIRTMSSYVRDCKTSRTQAQGEFTAFQVKF